MKNFQLTGFARAITFICGLALVVVLFVPLWQIQLNAPQYPEGLVLKMFPNKIAGNVDIINGLNHYIGMKTLHTKDFMEFTVLPYIITFFAAFCFLVVLLKKRKWLTALFILFVLFGITAMVDFWRWEYNYGHDLNPDAAIQIPGMAYQPPLIGYKKLLNFGAYSVPDIGGWIFVGVGLLLLITLILQFRKKRTQVIDRVKKTVAATSTVLIFVLMSCNTVPEPIKLGVDACSFCKMSIADKRFGAEIITKKGRVFKFDDMHCLLAFRKASTININDIKEIYLINFDEPHNFIKAPQAFLLKSDELHSPMNGNIANFIDENKLKEAAEKFKGEEVGWVTLLNEH
ncbi:MAG: nitrous oxide reductase accessory protein NosL [Ginsengibacter sp.]